MASCSHSAIFIKNNDNLWASDVRKQAGSCYLLLCRSLFTAWAHLSMFKCSTKVPPHITVLDPFAVGFVAHNCGCFKDIQKICLAE